MLGRGLFLCAVLVSPYSWAEEEVDAEIIVEGELRVEQARRAVEHELKLRGYVPKKRKKDYILFRHPQDWKGEIRLYDDGWVRMKRQPVQFTVPRIPALGKGAPVAAFLCLIAPTACIKTRGQTVSKRKFMGQKVRTLDELRPQVEAYAMAVSDLNTGYAVAELPEKLDALWQRGVSLSGAAMRLDAPSDRKAEILRFWESRTENRWGQRVRAAVEIYIREVVQYSETPFTEDEIVRFNHTRKCEAALDLGRPWDELELALDPAPPGP